MRTALLKYSIRRILWTIPVIIITTSFIFSLIHIMPGSPASVLLPPGQHTERNIELLTQEFQLDRPIHIQYLTWLWGLFTLDMGSSFLLNSPVEEILIRGIRRTMLLGLWAAILGIVVALPLGILSAVYKDSWIDDLSRTVAIGGISIPEFWLALLMIMIFAMMWNNTFGAPLIPSGGYHPIRNGVWGWARHTIGPAIVLAVPYGAVIARITRSSMADVLNEEYITTARSKGVKEKSIIMLHGLRNALIPVVTVAAYQVGAIFNGSVLVETVFSYPGLGWYIYRGANMQDYPLLMGATVFVVFIYIGLNLFADLLYAWIDPRIQYEGVTQR